MTPELSDVIISVAGAVGAMWAGINGAQRLGLIQRKDSTHLAAQATIVAMEAIEKRLGKLTTVTKEVAEGVEILRRQHGEPAAEGQYESWKIDPNMREDVATIANKIHAVGNMLTAVCGFLELSQMDNPTGDGITIMQQGVDDWKAVRRK